MKQMRNRQAATGPILFALVICSLFVGAASAASHRPVSLASGARNGYQWEVGVVRDGGRQGGRRPCLVISTLDPPGASSDGGFSGYTKGCSPLPPSGTPLIVTDTAGQGSRELMVFGMAITPRVVSAYLDFGSDGHMRVRLKQLNSEQQRNAGVRPLRYIAFSLKGDRCLREVKGYSDQGDEIYHSPIDQCVKEGG
jgi:hypothetical protein